MPAPIAPAAPVTSAVWPSSGGRAASSFACWNARYSILNRSRSARPRYPPMAATRSFTASVCAVMSRAIVEAWTSLPTASAPRPGSSRTRGSGSAGSPRPGTLARCFAT